MTTVGLIGSGNIGSAIARLAVEAGHQVVLSNSRGPETLADTAAQLGPREAAAAGGEAAAAGDIVVVTVPVKAFGDLPAAPLAGKTVIDTCKATGTPVWGTPYGPYSNEKCRPAGEDAIRAALAGATR